MLSITTGKPLTPGDLSILTRDAKGCIVDPVCVTYSIFALDDHDQLQLMTPPKLVPHRSGCGAYWVPITIPTTWPKGQYTLVWYVQYYNPEDPIAQVAMEFNVVPVDPATSNMEAPSVLFTPKAIILPKYAPAIAMVRNMLSDENPDKNYHFRPPTPNKVIAGFTDRVGFIWTDDTILRSLSFTISKLNWFNTKNIYSFTIDTVPYDWANCAAIGAAAFCLGKESARWAEEEFGYSLNGVSLDLRKADLYKGLRESYLQEFNEMADKITFNRPVSVGLRQQRWLLG